MRVDNKMNNSHILEDVIWPLVKALLMTLVILLVFASYTATFNKANAMSINPNPLVTADSITLGDIFPQAPTNKDYVLAPAPLPGEDLVWNARTLQRISNAFNLNWSPSRDQQQVTIQRLANIVNSNSLREAVIDALYAKEQFDERYDVSFAGNSAPNMVLPYGSEVNLSVKELNYDVLGKRYTATVAALDENGVAYETLRLSGFVHRVVSVPVLNKPLRNGDVIGQYDIDFIDLHQNDLRDDMIVSAENIIGMTPRRAVKADAPLRPIDIIAPKVVGRGKRVTMIYENGAISLTAIGKALEDGAKGDVIRISNIDSSRTVTGIVTAENEVTISSTSN